MKAATIRPFAAAADPVTGLMRRKKKITIFTIPNDGHLNILKRLIHQYRSSCAFQLVLVDQRNTPPDLSDLNIPVLTLTRSRYFTNTPTAQVFQRVSELLDECLEIAHAGRPDLIIYDFCALEGYFVARAMGIPFWCSIPGLVGPFTHADYLTDSLSSPVNQAAIGSIQQRLGVEVRRDDVEVISNCLHIPGELNLLWSYPSVTPRDFMRNRKKAKYQFAGYLSDGHVRPEGVSDNPLVYLSFGTEVMDNLWPAQEATRAGIRRCVAGLAELWKGRGFDVVFVTQGQSVLEHYPPNWTVHDKVDQQEVLSRADVFVTHGGSNSFHEALLFKVPMAVVPFFGDQVLVGKRAEELGIGIDLIRDDGIDKNKAKGFLNAGLVAEIDRAVRQLLDDDIYRKNFDDVSLESTPALAALAVHPDPGRPKTAAGMDGPHTWSPATLGR